MPTRPNARAIAMNEGLALRKATYNARKTGIPRRLPMTSSRSRASRPRKGVALEEAEEAEHGIGRWVNEVDGDRENDDDDAEQSSYAGK